VWGNVGFASNIFHFFSPKIRFKCLFDIVSYCLFPVQQQPQQQQQQQIHEEQTPPEKVTDEDLDMLENGRISRPVSESSDEGVNSEILQVEQRAAEEEKFSNSTFGKIVRTIQVC
jgi:hypothetical protein